MKDNYIVFSVAGTTYALPSQEVAHVELVENVTAVPNAPSYIDGVVFSRGAVVPALNLRARFGFSKASYDARTRLIIVQRGSRSVGMVVDSARETDFPSGLRLPGVSLKLSGKDDAYLIESARFDKWNGTTFDKAGEVVSTYEGQLKFEKPL